MPEAKPQRPKTDSAALDKLVRVRNYVRLWAERTATLRKKMRRDYQIAEGNGKLWDPLDRKKVEATGRPALEFNKALPQVEFICGMQRSAKVDFIGLPVGLEDRRLGEIATGSLKAASNFARLDRVNGRVFDDATICGMGIWKAYHTLDDAEDLVWGDIRVDRVNPLAFLWDPWAVDPDLADGKFMGEAWWMDIEDFKAAYPNYADLARPGEWLDWTRSAYGDSTDLGTPEELIPELFDAETGRIRVLNMWYKEPHSIHLLLNERDGGVREVASRAEGEKIIQEMREKAGREAAAPFTVVAQDNVSGVVGPDGQLMMDPQSGAPMQYANRESAEARLVQLSELVGIQAVDGVRVVSRETKIPYYCTMVWWQELESGKTPNQTRRYPFVPYISRRLSDDPDSIMGAVRNLHDPVLEYSKRWSNILAHLNSSSHSGYFNKKSGGANTKELELAGSKPGIVVEYSSVMPTQIHPVEMSQGHFSLLTTAQANIMEISGVNADMSGTRTPAPSVVSGRAIRSRQQSGSVILRPRMHNYEEAQLDLAQLMLQLIQQYFPVEKMKRVIGLMELNGPLSASGLPLFADPVTGMPMTEDQVIGMLKSIKTIGFDLTLKLTEDNPTERQAQFEQAMSVAQLITSTGRPLGPNTLMALTDMMEIPTRLAEGLKRDAMAPPMPEQAAAQQGAIQKGQAGTRGGRAGGSEAPQG